MGYYIEKVQGAINKNDGCHARAKQLSTEAASASRCNGAFLHEFATIVGSALDDIAAAMKAK